MANEKNEKNVNEAEKNNVPAAENQENKPAEKPAEETPKEERKKFKFHIPKVVKTAGKVIVGLGAVFGAGLGVANTIRIGGMQGQMNQMQDQISSTGDGAGNGGYTDTNPGAFSEHLDV